MLEDFLDVLLAVRDGCEGIEDVALQTGHDGPDTMRYVQLLADSGFLRSQDPGLRVTATGQRLLNAGFDEAFKRALSEKLGGEVDSAS